MFWKKNDSSSLSEEKIRTHLGSPDTLLGITVSPEGAVTLVLEVDANDIERSQAQKLAMEERVRSIPGVKEVRSVMTSERAQQEPQAQPDTRRVRKGARLSDEALRQSQTGEATAIPPISGISRILVVASAKGGVGKSTVSVNLAAAFAQQGLRVGLLDADIYGPSIPTMLGTSEHSPETSSDGKLIPVKAHGIETLSIGYLSDPDAPMIWRGPIVQSAITQMLQDASWGTAEDPLDLLIIDTPPGTGEAQLTLAQKVPVSAALIVTTPQEVALADVRRGAAMFAKTHVPVLGLIETMSWFDDPAGERHYLLGQGGGKRMADALGLPLMAQLPILPSIREGGDTGKPAALSDDNAKVMFTALARSVALAIDDLNTKPAPEIVFED